LLDLPWALLTWYEATGARGGWNSFNSYITLGGRRTLGRVSRKGVLLGTEVRYTLTRRSEGHKKWGLRGFWRRGKVIKGESRIPDADAGEKNQQNDGCWKRPREENGQIASREKRLCCVETSASLWGSPQAGTGKEKDEGVEYRRCVFPNIIADAEGEEGKDWRADQMDFLNVLKDGKKRRDQEESKQKNPKRSKRSGLSG